MEGLKKLCVAVSFRSENHSRKKEPEMLGEILYKFIGFNIRKIANAMRSHLDVENKLHWRLDVAMNEDDCRIRRGNVKSFF